MITITRRRVAAVLTAVAAGGALAACSGSSGSPSPTQQETGAVTHNFTTMERTQPVPQADSSQLRQTIIDAETAQIHGIATTSFFYNMGSQVPVMTCPSLGFPVPSTDQLTNPEKADQHGQYGDGTVTLPQGEPTGVYTGDTTGTYVVCVLSNGQKQVDYWEGFVYTAGGAAHFDKTAGQIVEDSSAVQAHVTH